MEQFSSGDRLILSDRKTSIIAEILQWGKKLFLHLPFTNALLVRKETEFCMGKGPKASDGFVAETNAS